MSDGPPPRPPAAGRGLLAVIIGLVAAIGLLLALVGAVLLGRIVAATPRNVAEDYLTAQGRGDWETQCDLSSTRLRHDLLQGLPAEDCAAYGEALAASDVGAVFAEVFEDMELDVEIVAVEEDGDTATADYTVTWEYVGDADVEDVLGVADHGRQRGRLRLVREDGDWRIAGEETASEQAG